MLQEIYSYEEDFLIDVLDNAKTYSSNFQRSSLSI